MAVKRNYLFAIPVAVIFLAVEIGYWVWQMQNKNTNDYVVFAIGSTLFAVTMFLAAMITTYTGEGSKLYGLKPVIDKVPAIKKPDGHVRFRTKMIWTFVTLLLYFALCNVIIYGLGDSMDLFSQFRAIMAGANGSLMHLGIGPIVTGSIIMQLFTGAKIISLDLTKSEDKAIYQGSQKVIVLVMILVEAIPQVYGYLNPSSNIIDYLGRSGARAIIVFQLFFGSYLVFLMDETVSKWGIGSGISLFIAAGVCQAIFTGSFSWLSLGSGAANYQLAADCPTGTFPKTWYLLSHMSGSDLAGGGFESIFWAPPNPIIALVSTMVIFFVVAYLESSRIEIPLAHGKVRGARGRYPIRLIYASNIPVILMSALLANVNMFSLLFWNHPTLKKFPLIGHTWWLGFYNEGQTEPAGGISWYVSRVNGIQSWLLPMINWERYQGYVYGHEYYQLIIHVLVYFTIMIVGSIIFAKFWIETTNMGPEDVAKQIQNSGMRIPGFRRDPRVLKKVLNRYIPMVTVLSGAFVGLLAAAADMIGTVGDTSGTGVLLTVGIIIRMYEDIAKQQMMELHPVLRGFFGNE